MGIELRLLFSPVQHRRTNSVQYARNQIETTYRNVWITGLAVPLGVDLHEEDLFLLNDDETALTFKLHFGHH